MPQQIIQTNFHFDLPTDDFKRTASAVATQFDHIPGLQWKIWLFNEERKEAGGIYLFVNKNAVTNFKNSELFHGIATNPAFHSFSVKQFEVLEAPSLFTHAPLSRRLTIL